MPEDRTAAPAAAGQQSELELYRAIVALMLEGVAVLRQSDTQIVWANERLTSIMGRDAGSLTGQPGQILLGSGDAATTPFPGPLTGMGAWDGMVVIPDRDGGSVHCRSAISTFSHPDHGPVWLAMLSPVDAGAPETAPISPRQIDRRGVTLPGRGTFQDDLTRELSRAKRTAEPVSVAMLSLDSQLDFSDPQTIDALAGATQAWRTSLRDSDSLAHYDFGEFDYVALLPNCPAEEAHMVTERTRAATPPPSTCSAGYATWDREESGLELAVRAHRAMKQAKRAGGNRSFPATS
jgi:GGDEF domain-containing protein